MVVEVAGFLLFGIVVGAYGTLVGAGGGFIIVPILLLVYHATPQQASDTSLVVVFFNALSGTLAYARQGKVDYQIGWRFAAATVPGALIGVYVQSYFSGRFFSALFGVLLLAIAVVLNLRPETSRMALHRLGGGPLPPGYIHRSLVDAHGEAYEYAFNLRGGLALSFVVGFRSSILGIGGGIIHVPAMVYLFAFPAHLATATSHFVLAITSLVGSTCGGDGGRRVADPPGCVKFRQRCWWRSSRGMRELHWHPNTDEWPYYINGRGRMTVFASSGKARTFDYRAGDEPLRLLEMVRSDPFPPNSLPDIASNHLPWKTNEVQGRVSIGWNDSAPPPACPVSRPRDPGGRPGRRRASAG